ncbi:MAG TPA: M28 family peptidase [Burkholderiales bacterium]|nr:M28 family peptidase [Burkholderiales bacterium]
MSGGLEQALRRHVRHPAGEIVLVGAHYDTVPGTPGADDNASGVAALLEIARSLRVDPQDPQALTRPAVLAAALERIETCLASFPSHAQVRRVWPTLRPRTIEDGPITPTLKIRRPELEKRFEREIERLFRTPAAESR